MSLLIGLSTVLNLFSVIYILQLGAKNNLSDGYHFRFTVLEHRTHYGLGAGINNLGLLQNWCDDFLRGTASVPKVTITNKSYTLSYANRIQVNGWWFTTSNNSIDSDPVKFIKIGTSRAIWSWSGTMLLSEDFYNTTIHRLMPAVFDLSVPWVWTGSGVACAIINLVASILILRMIAMQDQIRGIRLSAYSQVLIATVQMLASVGYSQLGSFDLDLMSASSAILYFGFALVLKFAEKYYQHFCFVAGFAFGLVSVLVEVLEQETHSFSPAACFYFSQFLHTSPESIVTSKLRGSLHRISGCMKIASND